MSRFIQLMFVFVFTIITIGTAVPQKTLITVYYESLCPDSRNFIINELKPAIRLLNPYIKLMLVPFGKAKRVNNNDFVCQHGPKECLGNMVQSCALQIMGESGANDLELVDYVACEMKTQAGADRNLWCVKQAQIDENLVASCISSSKGIEILLLNEYLTNLVGHAKVFIPTITFDQNFNQQIQDSALQDLTRTLCSYRRDMPPCSQQYEYNPI